MPNHTVTSTFSSKLQPQTPQARLIRVFLRMPGWLKDVESHRVPNDISRSKLPETLEHGRVKSLEGPEGSGSAGLGDADYQIPLALADEPIRNSWHH